MLDKYGAFPADPQVTEDAECEIVPPPPLPEPYLENGSEAREDNDRWIEQQSEQELLNSE